MQKFNETTEIRFLNWALFKKSLISLFMAVLVVSAMQKAAADAQKPPADKAAESASKANHTVLWWLGVPARDRKKYANIQGSLASCGWQLKLVEKGQELGSSTPDVYCLLHPQPIPDENWAKIRTDVKNGALAILVSFWAMPLEKYFDDPSFKVKVRGIAGVSLPQRHSQYLMPGEWSVKPYDLKLKVRVTPGYGIVPEQPEAWQTMGTMLADGSQPEKTMPFMLVRPYGKGLVFAMTGYVTAPVQLLENLYQNRDALAKVAAVLASGQTSTKDLVAKPEAVVDKQVNTQDE